jgi:hypothetical protein
MQPNNDQNPYYPARAQAEQPIPQGPTFAPPAGQSNFNGLGKSGPAWGWIITVTLLTIAVVGVSGFAIWAFGERQDYKNNSDKKSVAAAEVAKKQTTEEDNKRFAEELKNPLKTYVGPESYGSVAVQYPKTWSAYINSEGLSGNSIIDIYFHPDVVPSLASQGGGERPAIALHVEVLNQAYNQTISTMNSSVVAGLLTAEPYALPKVPNQKGTLFRGQLANKLNGTQVVLPLRDKTLVISTDTDQFLPDFNTYILPNLSFEP